ncbi:MAG TPA: response regulator transcription factor [Candidatus Dormibacteraeota bacterium]|nr:response regulator transcription factor [Candidatus Dormibacteraeota bacterium]
MPASKKKVRIVLVDDHEVLREGVRALFAKLRPQWEICGEGTAGEQAIALTHALEPDIVILDISMPRVSGLEACTRMRKAGLKAPVLIFTTHQSESLAGEARKVGAQGYVLKTQAARSLVLAIDTILSGGTFFGGPQEAKAPPKTAPTPELCAAGGYCQRPERGGAAQRERLLKRVFYKEKSISGFLFDWRCLPNLRTRQLDAQEFRGIEQQNLRPDGIL